MMTRVGVVLAVAVMTAACSGSGVSTGSSDGTGSSVDGSAPQARSAPALPDQSGSSHDPSPRQSTGPREPGRSDIEGHHKRWPASGVASSRGLTRPTGWGPTVGEWRAAQAAVAALSAEELAGQVIVARYSGTRAPLELVEQFHLGGVIMMEDNYRSVRATVSTNQSLQKHDARPWPLVIGVDQEGGMVTRLREPLTQFPTYMSLGAAGDPDLARRVAHASGDELRAAGFTMVFAPDADVTVGALDPTIGSRSAGDDAVDVADVVQASTQGFMESGIVPVLKHFPGHGSVTADSHLTLPHQDAGTAQLARRDFVPFAAGVKVGAPAMMMAHISVDEVAPDVPADLAPQVVQLLTEGLGFEGLVVTDALEMEAVVTGYGAGNAAVAALNAGSDLLLMPADVQAAHGAIVAALADGSLSRERLEEAAAKVVALMMHQKGADQVDFSVIGSHRHLAMRVSAEALTVIQGRCKGPYLEGPFTATGDRATVATFQRLAIRHGLTVGTGTTVALIDAYGDPVDADIVVSLDTPYVLAASSASVAKLALYGSTPPALEALVRALVGEAAPRGHLPVDVPGIDAPSC